jgi:hypothetical protein
MKKAALTAIFLSAIACPALAQPKQDIRGFSPGMSQAAFDEQLKKSNCGHSRCDLGDGILKFIFSKTGKPPLLKEVQFEVKSGADPEEMIALTSKQFGVHTIKADNKKDIAYAKSLRTTYVPLFNKYMLVSGGTIANWNLTNGLILRLDMSATGKDLNQYSFYLYSQRIIDDEKKTAREAREEEKRKAKSVNPAPKL